MRTIAILCDLTILCLIAAASAVPVNMPNWTARQEREETERLRWALIYYARNGAFPDPAPIFPSGRWVYEFRPEGPRRLPEGPDDQLLRLGINYGGVQIEGEDGVVIGA